MGDRYRGRVWRVGRASAGRVASCMAHRHRRVSIGEVAHARGLRSGARRPPAERSRWGDPTVSTGLSLAGSITYRIIMEPFHSANFTVESLAELH